MISFMQPHFRTKYLAGIHADRLEGLRIEQHEQVNAFGSAEGRCERYGWDLSWQQIDMGEASLGHFLYVMKNPGWVV
tara:strand:- start:61 stop:291 length:231 start_codon:yes stop_codon:yes gene_type:complete